MQGGTAVKEVEDTSFRIQHPKLFERTVEKRDSVCRTDTTVQPSETSPTLVELKSSCTISQGREN